jgi:uncharacterized protein (TIGR00159 family)
MDLFSEFFYSISIPNVIDIMIMATLIHFLLVWVSWTRAIQIIAFLVGMGLFYFIASESGLVLTSLLFEYLWAALIIVLVIVFQPEIRNILDRARPIRFLTGKSRANGDSEIMEEILKAVAELARMRLGALLVFQRVDQLDNLIVKGSELDCLINSETIVMIFQKTSPLHDGAILIHHDRIKAASCILPLSSDESLAARYGTRHRAALGLSERSDSICVVVSEERGEVSLVDNKEIANFRKKEDFRHALERGLQLGRVTPSSPMNRHSSILTRNWRFKLLSLVTAALLWLVVVGPERSEIGVSVPIQYTGLPEDMELTGKWMDKLDAMVRGSQAALSNLKPGSVRAAVDLGRVVTGLNFYRITKRNITTPPGIAIAKIRPSDLRLHIEASSSRTVKVSTATIGPLPPGVELSVTPSQVKVKAPKEELEKLKAVVTAPIDVQLLGPRGKMQVQTLIRPDGLNIDSVTPSTVTVTTEAAHR